MSAIINMSAIIREEIKKFLTWMYEHQECLPKHLLGRKILSMISIMDSVKILQNL